MDDYIVLAYKWVILELRRAHGVAAYEEGTGGNNFHIAFADRRGRFILADCNDGYWRAGRYASRNYAEEEGEIIEAPEHLALGGTSPGEVASWLADLWGDD